MIYLIEGEKFDLGEHYVIVKNSGVGYYVNISKSTCSELYYSDYVQLYTYHNIREDKQELFGFLDASERSLFQLLIGAKGVGCSFALRIFDTLSYEEIVNALESENYLAFKGCKGIGEKTAKAIIQHLKGKF